MHWTTSIEGFGLAFPADKDEEVSSAPSTAPVEVAALVPAYAALLFRVAYSILRNSAEAEDVVQEVFLRVLQKQSSLAEIREMRIWLVRVAWNLALDRRRRIRPQQLDEAFAQTLVSTTAPADANLASAAQVNVILREIDRLPARERQVLLLTAVEELDTPEIACILHRTESATRSLLHRARTRLRERLQKRSS